MTDINLAKKLLIGYKICPYTCVCEKCIHYTVYAYDEFGIPVAKCYNGKIKNK